jgi:hypothetical protein
VLPVSVNGTCNWNMLPKLWLCALPYHGEKAELNGTVKVAPPENCVPELAVNVNVADVMSRVVE